MEKNLIILDLIYEMFKNYKTVLSCNSETHNRIDSRIGVAKEGHATPIILMRNSAVTHICRFLCRFNTLIRKNSQISTTLCYLNRQLIENSKFFYFNNFELPLKQKIA